MRCGPVPLPIVASRTRVAPGSLNMWEWGPHPHRSRNIAQPVFDIVSSCTTVNLGFSQFGLNQVTPWSVETLAYTGFSALNFYEHATLPPPFRDSHSCGRDKLIDHCRSQHYKQPLAALVIQRLLQRTSLEHLLKTQYAMPVIEKHCAEVFGFTLTKS